MTSFLSCESMLTAHKSLYLFEFPVDFDVDQFCRQSLKIPKETQSTKRISMRKQNDRAYVINECSGELAGLLPLFVDNNEKDAFRFGMKDSFCVSNCSFAV